MDIQETPDVVHVLILQLARGAWSTLARLLQLACLTLDFKPLLAHEMARAGATGVVLDILCQAPRHHPVWRSLSTAGAGLLAALVRCEDGTEAAQPQALRMLLAMLESDLTCGPARQAVATVLHCVVAQRTVHRDKLLAVGALPVLVRVLGRLDVLCDLVAVQEVLWTLVYLTDESALALAGGGRGGDGMPGSAESLQPVLAEQLVPLLFLYAMPWNKQHEHLAALVTRALHVHVAGYDMGKDTLRNSGVLSVLVDTVGRHSAPYITAAEAAAAHLRGRHDYDRGVTAIAIAGASCVTAERGMQQTGAAQGPAALASRGHLVPAASRGSFAVGSSRPPPHTACHIHADGEMLRNGTTENGPYACGAAAALGTWTPWERLLAVLLIVGIAPAMMRPQRRGRGGGGGAAAASGLTANAASAAAGTAPDEESGEPSTPSSLRSEGPGEDYGETDSAADRGPGASGKRGKEQGPTASDGVAAAVEQVTTADALQQLGLDEEEDDDDDVFGGIVLDLVADLPAALEFQSSAAAQPGATRTEAAVANGARLVCYGLLLPLLIDAGEEAAAGGAGSAAVAVGGALLRRRLCPLRESLATLKTMLCDCEANQLAAAEQGLAVLLVQLVAHGDMGLAWQAAETAVYLSGGATGAVLVAAGAAEEMAYLLEESADMLHSLTLRKQIQVQCSSLAHGDHHHNYHNHRHHAQPVKGAQLPHPRNNQPTRTSSTGAGGPGVAAAAAVAVPPLLTDVHVRPTRSTGVQYSGGARPQRMYLLGRVPLDFTTSGSCFYGTHDAMSYCDYCTPSAAIQVLLRLIAARPTAAPQAVVAQENAVCRRFAAAGGMYGVLLLLHHEAAGVHHSKLAASLLTLLDLVLIHVPEAKDELRLAGGLGVLSTLLGSLMRPGVMDVYQLRVATCRTLQLALRGNAANKLAAREHGLLPLLVSLLSVLWQQRKARSREVVVDDSGPLTMAVLEALAAASHESPGTQAGIGGNMDAEQEALVALGVLHPLCDLLLDEGLDVEVRTVAVRTMTTIVDKCQAGQGGVLATGVVKHAVAWLEHCCTAAAGGVTATGLRDGCGRSHTAPPNLAELAEQAAALASLLGAMLRGSSSNAKPAIVSAGALGVLLQLLRSSALAAGGLSSSSGSDDVMGLAAAVLATLVDGDTDLQNELVAQGGLTAAADIVRDGGAAAPQALTLLSAMLRSNTFVKNNARQAGVPATLVEAVRHCGLVQRANAAAAASALTELAAGNHANQEAVAVQGGLEVTVDLLRDAFAALPMTVFAGGAAAAAGAATAAAEMAGAEVDVDTGDGLAYASGSSTSATGPEMDSSSKAAAAAVAMTAMPYTAVQAAQDTASVTSLSRLMRALLGLVCACVELNGGNKSYIRELGGVSFLGEFLVATAEVLTAPPPPSWAPYSPHQHDQCQSGRWDQRSCRSSADGHGERAGGETAVVAVAARLRDAAASSRAALSPAVAAACSALVAVTRESSANLARLEEHSGLAVALFKLLVATDAATSLAAALAIEWLVVRSNTFLDAPGREAFELNLVDVLSLALYVPYAPLPLVLPSAPPTDNATAYAAWQKQQQRLRQEPWFIVVRALMPADGLTAAAVRDAAAVLTAVADAADALVGSLPKRQPQPQQQQATSAAAVGKQGLMATSRGSLPPLETVPIDPVASDHNSGLMVSNLLAGPSAFAAAAGVVAADAAAAISDTPGSQAWWAKLAGWAAAAFQRVANGVLQGAPTATVGGAAVAIAAPSTTGASPAAQDRRRQVAWMLFLLAVRAPGNRARMRWLVRASLSPLAQQLNNAEMCRAQLEAAAASPPDPTSVPRSGSGVRQGTGFTAAAVEFGRASSAALESASSVKGRLPISTAALEELSDGVRRPPSPLGSRHHHPACIVAEPPMPPPPPPPPPPPASQGLAGPPRPPSRPTSSSSASGAAHGISAKSTPRASLTGAVAAAFASPMPYLGGMTAGRGSRGASPSSIRPGGVGAPFATAAAMATPPPGQRSLRPQVSGGGSSVMSDDDELAMIQQEVALLANTTSSLTWSARMAGNRSGGTGGNSPAAAAASPVRWGMGSAVRR
ncbi:hypothetical protein VOLCADRAFT_85920 [Volvox carteri f. nagariensis]|uniref:Uncharacterized protein n=1 Tax=Volvox carteri f. nagariensis TaxID=3068 RepID=D8THC6_VOLCA|nr:uncharacterized protein VOLCADRAFT_85920 [Volvox carteri f. nagariensis]EFJ53048.1 hypothetical protein VOLCADRAFT_85920 [Volvox carteri f. nagariensis]|eukprot:XP_002946053.1 hypothetical protein VOLCADRAFT_85920 [Volvox carteri f. nagariensis]